MTFNVNLTITNIQEAQDANLRAIAALQPDGEFGEAIRDAVTMLHRYATSITHLGRYRQSKSGRWHYDLQGTGGGALRASQSMEVRGLYGRVFIDPSSVNPMTGQKPSVYGVYENARGGTHAFYDRTISEYGDQVMNDVGRRVAFAVVK